MSTDSARSSFQIAAHLLPPVDQSWVFLKCPSKNWIYLNCDGPYSEEKILWKHMFIPELDFDFTVTF